MTAPKLIPRIGRHKRWQFGLGILLLLIAMFAAWFLTSDGFRNFVRGRIVNRIEEASGGRVELKAFRWNLSQMEFEADDLTIHGKEKPGEQAFAHFDRMYAQVKVISFFRREVDLQYLSITGPSLHLIVYPDGTTNQPIPRIKNERNNPVQPIFDLAVGKLQLQQGELVLNEQRIPVDFDANDVSLGMTYDVPAKRFDGAMHVGRAEAKLKDWRPLPLRAELVFSLFESRAQVKSLKLISGRSQVEATGDVHDFLKPLAELGYKAHLDTRELAAAARLRSVSGGTVDLDGQGRWSLEHFASSGKAQVHGLVYSDSVVRAASIDGSTLYSADEQRLSLAHIAARIFQGSATGTAEVNGWLEGAKSSSNGSADLQVQGIRLQPVAEAVATRKLPLDKLNLAGQTSGSVKASWRKPSEIVAKLDLRVDPLPVIQPGQLPTTANLDGTYFAKSESLQLDHLDATTPSTNIVANGTLGSEQAQLKVALNSQRITEFEPLIEAIGGPDSPLLLNGAAKFQGTITGRFKSPTLVGHVELHDFSTVLPGNVGNTNSQVVRWDALVGELHYSPDQLSLARSSLQRGKANVLFDGSSTLQNGKFTESSSVTLRANVRGAEVVDLQALAGYHYPVSGRLDASLQMSGTRTSLTGGAHLQLNDAVAYGEPIRSSSLDFHFAGKDIEARNLRVIGKAGGVSGGGAFNLKNSRFTFDLHGTNIHLEELRLLQQKRIEVQGVTSFDATGEGTPGEPIVNAKIQLRNLVLSGEPVGGLDLNATTRGEDLKVTGRSNFLNASLGLDGIVRLRGELPMHLIVDFTNLDADSIIRGYLKQFHLTSHTLLAGHLRVDGPLRQPENMSADGSIHSFAAGIENVKVVNEGPIHFALNRQVVSIDNLHLVGDGTNFNAGGTIALSGDRALNVRANGSVNLRILQSFSPEYTASGMTTLNMRATGSMQHPQLRGRIQIRDGAISYVDLPNGLSGINGSLIFTEDRLQVQDLTARTGGGELVLGGFIAYSHELTFNLTARGKDVRLRYPPGVSSSGDANLTLAGTPKNALLSGEITVTRFGLNPRFDFANYLARSKQPQAPVKSDSPLNGLRMDIHVVSTPELQVETSLAKVTGNVDIHLRGSGAKPVVLGRVTIIEGDLTFNGTTYHLERGEISFSNPTFIEPVLDVEASAHVRDYDITLGFHGPADHPSTNYRSDPPLPTADIIALLALGRTRQESAQAQMYNPQQTTITDSASNELLGQALNATVSSRVQKLFGVSRIKIDPQVGGPENNANARLTIEQQVSNKVTLTYITNLSQSAQQIIQFEYNVSRDVSIIAVRDQTGVVGFDVRIRQRKK